MNPIFQRLAVALLIATTVQAGAVQAVPIPPAVRSASLVQIVFHRPAPATRPIIPSGHQIIGNKRTHVYHLPGDKGMMPAAKNRVYFDSEAEAAAAGYRPARRGFARGPRVKKSMMHGMRPH